MNIPAALRRGSLMARLGHLNPDPTPTCAETCAEMPTMPPDPAADALELIQRAVDDARNPRLGTDTRLGHALTAITYLTRWARYQDDRQRLLAAEVYLLRQNGGRVIP